MMCKKVNIVAKQQQRHFAVSVSSRSGCDSSVRLINPVVVAWCGFSARCAPPWPRTSGRPLHS